MDLVEVEELMSVLEILLIYDQSGPRLAIHFNNGKLQLVYLS